MKISCEWFFKLKTMISKTKNPVELWYFLQNMLWRLGVIKYSLLREAIFQWTTHYPMTELETFTALSVHNYNSAHKNLRSSICLNQVKKVHSRRSIQSKGYY